ncbi:ABC transporter ATP-binding protein [Nocardia sp. CA2R105]|uniref:ABC transporter ATP-binding protein n=1 Tax=Nocardia coffeae TaxID=2873381 RepID=UPI001CA60138|nr:ABC transporter ATP-binding protein [Nocardia coffeae]MBY8858029.1 ABC transporter ATP-binding protein [Nocardia coffeae]
MTSVERRKTTVPGQDRRSTTVLEVQDLVAYHGVNRVVAGLDLTIEQGEFVTLLGPSGCGKTTTLRCVAGLHRVSDGTIALDGRTVASDKTHVRAERRSVNMVFQSYALWPHMSVFANVAYGLKAQRLPKAEIAERTEEMLELVGLGGYGPRPATGLSGGQQQRVVLARGLVTRPKLLLLDEPLSNLDTELRTRMRTEIHSLQRRLGLTMLYVTHDRTEALALSDKVVVMRNGIAQQIGSPDELYDRPVNRFVAEALGPVNVLPATAVDGGSAQLITHDGGSVVPIALGNDGAHPAAGAPIDVLIRPEALVVEPRADGADGIPAEVTLVEYLGNRTEITCRSGAQVFKVELARRPGGIQSGDKVTARLHPGETAPAWQRRETP